MINVSKYPVNFKRCKPYLTLGLVFAPFKLGFCVTVLFPKSRVGKTLHDFVSVSIARGDCEFSEKDEGTLPEAYLKWDNLITCISELPNVPRTATGSRHFEHESL